MRYFEDFPVADAEIEDIDLEFVEEYLDTQIKEKSYLGSDGRVVTEGEFPKFMRQEIIVNAVIHRMQYSQYLRHDF